ncbi:MAG: Lrp/AsnC family transcriptional regulator [Paludibacteraceae bacterium]|nr:Lrp/AsnC family transcriptional regulator [Paludibacteraceae bacterium]
MTGRKRRGEEHDLRNRILHVDWDKVKDRNLFQSAKNEVQSAKNDEELPPKCNFCTLDEIALLRIVQKNPSATQKEIAVEIRKSERTVKSITIALQERNILRRVNGKRNGYWKIVTD